MIVMLLAVHYLEFLSLKEATQAHLILYMSNCHIVGNHMSRLIIIYIMYTRLICFLLFIAASKMDI